MFSKGSFLLKVKHIVEAAVVLPVYYLLKILPFGIASYFVGKTLRILGPLFKRPHQTMLMNLKFCFPEKADFEIEEISLNVWENLGRTAGELAHVTSYPNAKMQELCPISGLENVEATEAYAKNKATGFMIVSAHIGNWEMASRMLFVMDPNTALIYRKANNPYVEELIQNMRDKYTDFIIPKGDKGGVRDIVKHIKAGGRLGMLVDQKSSDGVDVDFFGTKVKAPATAGEFATKYGMPIVMTRVIRDEKTKLSFVFKFESPIYPENKTVEEITQQIYSTYEKWIRQHPTQWLWQHDRFSLWKNRK